MLVADSIESPEVLTCTKGGPFGTDTSHKKLTAKFGASNVAYRKGEEDLESGTTLYPRDPTASVFIVWKDDKRRSRPERINTHASRWSIAGKLRVGMNLQQVQALNGKPFIVDAFEGITDWRGGALERVGDGCRLHVILDPQTAELGNVLSDDPRLRPFNPTVSTINVLYE